MQMNLENVVEVTVKPHGWISKSLNFAIHLQEGYVKSQVEFECRENRDILVGKIQQMLKARHWDTVPIYTQTRPKKSEFATTKAGISGLIKTQEDKHKEIGSTLNQAFTDLKALMANAADMVALAERLNSNHNPSEDNDVRDIMIEMGMVASPVTKEMAGNLFHSELARQLTDILDDHLIKKNKGIIALTDVYCLYNRARGTELISPDDLYQACLLFEKLNLPLRLRKFESSGVLALQSTSYDDKVVLDAIKEMVSNGSFPVTAIQFAQLQNISVPLANYFLQKAEEEGTLCRDDSYEGLIFYHNIF